ncbi:uncharacterized protein [Chiloscyllium punctatum]|uniref:uncharacterized protein isoform X2 n=1 Tax=Chiloscyllium punctatum TaxID=137246 RepID=UPI003B638D9B
MDEMSNRSEERIAVMPPVHSNDQNPTEIVNKDDHLYLEDEGLNKNPRSLGYNAAAAPIESTIPDTELTKDSERQQGGPSENVEEPVNSMHPNQLQQNALTERELEHQEENAHMETIFSSDSSNEDVSTTNNMFEEVPPGLEENCGHQNDRNTTGPEGDNNVNMATLATVADIQQSKDAALQQDNTLKIKEDMDENKEENAMTEKLCCKDIYNDIKPTDEANAESSRQPPQNGAQENSKNVSVADIPQSGDVDRQQDNPLEISEEDVDKVSCKEEYAVTEALCCKDTCKDIKPTDAENAYLAQQLHRNGAHENMNNVSEGDNNVNMATLATVADIQQSKDAPLQQENKFKIKKDTEENKEENALTDTLCCQDNCNDIKPMAETNAESSRQPHPDGAHEKGKNVSESDNEDDANLSTGDDIPESKDAERQQNNPLELSTEDVYKNQEVTEPLCCKDTCNDTKPTDVANAYSDTQLHQNGAHENGKSVSEADIQQSRDAELQKDKLLEISKEDVDKNKEKNIVSETTDICNDIKSRNSMNGDSAPQPHSNGDQENSIHAQALESPVLHGDSTDAHMCEESTNMTTDSSTLLHNGETKDSVNIQSPQKALQDELQACREGYVKTIIPLFSTATPQQEMGNVKSTPTSPSLVRNPRPSGLLQEENISIGGPSINMLPDGKSFPFGTAVKAKGPGAVENSDKVPESPVLHGDSTDEHMCEESTNMTTDSSTLLHNGETKDSVNIQSPQKALQDELQACREGYVKTIIPLFSTATPQQEMGNVKSTPTSPSLVRNPRPSGLLQEENISIGGPSINMLPDGKSFPSGTAVKAKGPGAVENSDKVPDIPRLHGHSTECEELRNMTTDSASLLHNSETQDSVSIQSPHKPLQDELQVCREGHVKTVIPLFSTIKLQHELDNVQITPTCPSPVRNPRPIGLLQEENISSGGPSSNMLPDGMSIPFGTAVKAKGPEADIPFVHGDFMDQYTSEESRNMTTDSSSSLHNRETQDDVNIKSPQKPLQDELQICRKGHVKAIIPLLSNTTPQHELDNVKITPASPSPVRKPTSTSLLQEEKVSDNFSRNNMPPDGRNVFFDSAGKAKGPGGDVSPMCAHVMDQNADDGSKLNEFLRNVSEYDLQALTTHFKQRLKDAVEEFGQQLVVNLLSKQLISDKESEHSRRLIKEKCKSEASKFIFDKVRTIGFVAVKTMWEICVNVDGVTPKLNEIRKDLLKKVEEVKLCEFLRNVSESDLQVFTTDYRKSLEDAVDEFGQHVALNLLNKCFITDKESEYMRKMIHEKRKSEAFQLILDKVTVNGIGAKKIMWETCLKMNDTTPKLSKIRNDLLKQVYSTYSS